MFSPVLRNVIDGQNVGVIDAANRTFFAIMRERIFPKPISAPPIGFRFRYGFFLGRLPLAGHWWLLVFGPISFRQFTLTTNATPPVPRPLQFRVLITNFAVFSAHRLHDTMPSHVCQLYCSLVYSFWARPKPQAGQNCRDEDEGADSKYHPHTPSHDSAKRRLWLDSWFVSFGDGG